MNILGMFGPGPNPSATLLINGKLIEGNKSVDKFRNVIENILTK